MPFVGRFLSADPKLPERLRRHLQNLAKLAEEQNFDPTPLLDELSAKIEAEAKVFDKVDIGLAASYRHVLRRPIDEMRKLASE
jgi:hypothetical protein